MYKILVLTLVFLSPPQVHAGGAPFSVASESLPPLAEGTESATLLLRLKQQAVREYLQRTLGPRYERYDGLVSPDFAERYILDYQVSRQSPDSSQMEIAGHLDVDALKQWVRVSETKATGSTILKPLFILSADLPGFAMDPKQTATQVKQNPIAQTLFQRFNDIFQKFNATLATSEDLSMPLSRPPTRDAEIRTLRSFGNTGGYNSVVWVNLSTCKQCGIRMDFLLFNLTQARQVQSVSVDVEMPLSELNDPKKLMKAVGKTLQDFSAGFEESVSKGTLFALEYRFIVEGVDSYKTFKQIDSMLPKQDFVIQSSVSRSAKRTAEFRILSSLPPKEFFQRLHVAQFPGMTLKPIRIDAQTVTVRYLN